MVSLRWMGCLWLCWTFWLARGCAVFSVSASSIFWTYAVGLVFTAVAAVTPAIRASRIPPMAALRDDVAMPESTLRRRLVIGTVLVLAGAASMVLGFMGEGSLGLSLIGLGALLVLFGVSLMSALLGRPLLTMFGVVYRRLFGP